MKKTKLLIAVILLIAVLVFVKIQFLSEDAAPAGGGGRQNKSAVTNVNAYVVKPEKLGNEIFVTGTVLASEEADLVSEISGKIISMPMQEGSPVAKGDLLVKINDAELQAQLKKLRSQENLVKENESRQKKLLDINGVSREEYETSLNSLNAVQADIELVNAQIAKTEIRAPFSGVVGLKYASEGSYISMGARIASIQQLDPVKVDFSVPEKYASLLQKGEAVRFTVESVSETFGAKIIAVEPKVDISTRTVQVRASCPNQQKKILPGSFARIRIVLKESENSIMIPTEALIPVLKGYKVFVARNGKAEEVTVQAGLRTEKNIQITGGLTAGDSVLTTGIMQLKAEAPVKIISVR